MLFLEAGPGKAVVEGPESRLRLSQGSPLPFQRCSCTIHVLAWCGWCSGNASGCGPEVACSIPALTPSLPAAVLAQCVFMDYTIHGSLRRGKRTRYRLVH